jgi:quercetin dioxygenase-like cupin family protein
MQEDDPKRREFEAQLVSEGFEIALVEREPNGFLDTHEHPFEAKALILAGEISIGTGETDRRYRAGEIFHLQAGVPHTERYGPQGVRYLAGRKA